MDIRIVEYVYIQTTKEETSCFQTTVQKYFTDACEFQYNTTISKTKFGGDAKYLNDIIFNVLI